MVYLSVSEEINRIKNNILFQGGLEASFYNFVKNNSHTISVNEFEYLEDRIAFKGFCGEEIKKSDIEYIFNRKSVKGIDYSSNIFRFLGVHLAAGTEYIDNLNTKFDSCGIKYKYSIMKCFPQFHSNLINTLINNLDSDIYSTLLNYVYVDKNKSFDEIKLILQDFLSGINCFDAIDLALLEEIQLKSLGLRYCEYSATDTVIKILNNFSNSIKRITTNRYSNRAGINIKSEYDVQDILFALLKGFFEDLERENPIPKQAGISNRIDLNIKSQGIMVEIKMIKETDCDHKKYIRQLKEDIVSYSAWNDLKDLILFTYDPYNRTTDTTHFKGLNGSAEYNGIRYYVHSLLIQ